MVVLMPTDQQQGIHIERLDSPSSGSAIEVRIRVSAEGVEDIEGHPTRVWLVHDLLGDRGRPIYQKGVELADAQGVDFTYRVLVGDDVPERLESRLWVARFQGADVKLRIFDASLKEVTPAEDGPDAGTVTRVVDEEPEFFSTEPEANPSAASPRVTTQPPEDGTSPPHPSKRAAGDGR